MTPSRQVKLLAAAVVAASLLLVFALLVHRQPAGDVITHQVQDLIATLQAPFEGLDAPIGMHGEQGGTGRTIALLLVAAALGAVLVWRRRVRAQQRERSSSS